MRELTKRERIVRELIARLKTGFPLVPIERGFVDDVVNQFPSIYLGEDTEAKVLHPTTRRGQYHCELPVVVVYFTKGDTKKTLYEKANYALGEIASAVETDEEFSGMCTRYWMAEADLYFHPNLTIQVVATYRFAYTTFAPWLQAG